MISLAKKGRKGKEEEEEKQKTEFAGTSFFSVTAFITFRRQAQFLPKPLPEFRVSVQDEHCCG